MFCNSIQLENVILIHINENIEKIVSFLVFDEGKISAVKQFKFNFSFHVFYSILLRLSHSFI